MKTRTEREMYCMIFWLWFPLNFCIPIVLLAPVFLFVFNLIYLINYIYRFCCWCCSDSGSSSCFLPSDLFSFNIEVLLAGCLLSWNVDIILKVCCKNNSIKTFLFLVCSFCESECYSNQGRSLFVVKYSIEKRKTVCRSSVCEWAEQPEEPFSVSITQE